MTLADREQYSLLLSRKSEKLIVIVTYYFLLLFLSIRKVTQCWKIERTKISLRS